MKGKAHVANSIEFFFAVMFTNRATAYDGSIAVSAFRLGADAAIVVELTSLLCALVVLCLFFGLATVQIAWSSSFLLTPSCPGPGGRASLTKSVEHLFRSRADQFKALD